MTALPSMVKIQLTISILFFSIGFFAQDCLAGELDYAPRGNPPDRYEGIKASPVSGLDIELISALIVYPEEEKVTPPNYKLKFYLQEPSVYITVRELRPTHYYWLDRVSQNWQKGFNVYQWQTKEVIEPLKLKISKLGVVARLTDQGGGETEYVTPVALYHTNPPVTVSGYLFTFKVNGNAELNYMLYQGDSGIPIVEEKLGKQITGEPFPIYWDSSQAMEGYYELVLEGYFLNNGMSVYQSVQFYHKPNWATK